MAQRYTGTYYLLPTQPYVVHLTVLADLEVGISESAPFEFDTFDEGTFSKAHQLASAIAQTFAQLQGGTVRWSSFGVTTYDNLDPDVVLGEDIQEIEYVNTNGLIGGGPDNRVMGLKCKVPASGRASLLRVGLLATGTAPVGNGQVLNAGLGLPRLVKLRSYLNTLVRVTRTGTANVNTTWTQLSSFENKVYHGVARA